MTVTMDTCGTVKDVGRDKRAIKVRKMLKKPGAFDIAVSNVISTPLEEGLGEFTNSRRKSESMDTYED
jgi:hypothetical protein